MQDIQIVGNFLKIHLRLFKGNFKKELVLIAEPKRKKDEYEHLKNVKWIIRNQAPSCRYARQMEKAQRVDGCRSLGVSNSYKGLRCIPRYK